MRFYGFTVFVFVFILSASAQKKIGDFIESQSYNDDKQGTERRMQYIPDGNDFVCYNGKNRFTRALYGGYTDFRLETSDMPVFATYKKGNYRNISLRLNSVPLDSAHYCESRYSAGKRIYQLSDARWGNGKLTVTALVSPDAECAIISFETSGFSEKANMQAVISDIRNRKLHRNGDMGVEQPGSFEAGKQLQVLNWDAAGTTLLSAEIVDKETKVTINNDESVMHYNRALQHSEDLASQITFLTPDPYINTLGATLTTAADGDWDGKTWLHGCIGWRMPLAGWRAGYVGDVLGWNDRAIKHFNAYAASQVTNVPPTMPHPTQDSTLNLARAEKKWGTQMYSNGYICRNPERNNQMHHYDMNLNYIDELLWHFCYDADKEYLKKMWPVIKLHLQWEKRNFDPDDDGLYDAYCCIWASDALYYNSGAVTHSSAYNLRAFRMAARIAEILGEDPTWFKQEADKTQKAMNSRLWLSDKGVWAEYQDFMGFKRTHNVPALWTIYSAIDCGAGDVSQNYSATQWIDINIPHIAVDWIADSEELSDKGPFFTLSTSNWMPYSWSINNVAPAEIMHTALAYFESYRNEEGFKLLKSNILDQMYIGSSPGNFGQLSFYDAARGECYRDFGDVIGISSRALVQGLYGIVPDALNGKCIIRPGFPKDWDVASINTPYINYTYQREGDSITVWIEQNFNQPLQIVLDNKGTLIYGTDEKEQFLKYKETKKMSKELVQDDTSFQSGSDIPVPLTLPDYGTALDDVKSSGMKCINLNKYYNSSVDDIFENKYLSPRSPYTTLQIPVQGIGEWCHPQLTAEISDYGFRSMLKRNTFHAAGIPFKSDKNGKNIIYTSLFNNYPDSVTIPVKENASHAYLLMAGSTNHMQSHIANGKVFATYEDGTTDELILENPYNWCPIEQDYYIDNKAFSVGNVPPPYRVHLASGKVSRDLGKELNIKGVYGREIKGGAAEILDLKLNPEKTLQSITICTLSNDVVIGLMSLTLQK